MKVSQSCPTLCNPLDCIVCGILQARILEWVTFSFSRGSSQPRDRTQVFGNAGGFFTSWATREAQEYWSGSLSLLQGILLTQKSNCGLLHCRRILYHLSYQGSLMVQYQAQVLIYLFKWIIRMTWLRQQKSTDFWAWGEGSGDQRHKIVWCLDSGYYSQMWGRKHQFA